jgi:hypothetical protein
MLSKEQIEEQRKQSAVELLAKGCKRSDAAKLLQEQHKISSATAYRLLRLAEQTMPPDYHQVSTNLGTLDPLAEVEALYRRQIKANENAEARKTIALLHRIRMDTIRLQPYDLMEIEESKQAIPF